jgi:PTS system fructose-specific IIB component
MMEFVAVTACPTGIAHSQMAAENLETTAEERGHDIHVEVHGAMGTENEIPADVLASADAAIVAADTSVQTDRFEGMVLVKGTVKDAVNDPGGLMNEAIERIEGGDGETPTTDAAEAKATEPETGSTDAGTGSAAATTDPAGDTTGGVENEEVTDSRDEGGLIARLKRLFS